jgi:hypothetical protein
MDGSAAEQFRAQLALHVWGLCRRQTPFDRVPDTPGDHRNLEEILLIVHRIRQMAIEILSQSVLSITLLIRKVTIEILKKYF